MELMKYVGKLFSTATCDHLIIYEYRVDLKTSLRWLNNNINQLNIKVQKSNLNGIKYLNCIEWAAKAFVGLAHLAIQNKTMAGQCIRVKISGLNILGI